MVILVVLLLFLPHVAVVAKAEEQVQAPVFQEGDFWQFKVTDRAGNGVSTSRGIIPDGVYVFRASNGRLRVSQIVSNEEMTLDGTGLLSFLMGWRYRTPEASQTETSQELNFPLFVGKKWQYEYDLKIR